MENPYNRPKHPLLIIISGPSGVGKDTIARLMMDTKNDNYYFVVTATTRPPRAGEVHGYDYFFVSHDEFARMIEADELLEYAIVYNDYKGVPKQQIREALASGKDVIMRVDPQGAATIRKLVPQGTFIFLSTHKGSMKKQPCLFHHGLRPWRASLTRGRSSRSRRSPCPYKLLGLTPHLDGGSQATPNQSRRHHPPKGNRCC
jgi:guanylate kinase